MDTLSHGLWAAAGYKIIAKDKNPKKAWWAAFWGMFPDLLAFVIPFLWMGYGLIVGNMNYSDLPDPDSAEPMPRDTIWVFRVASALYNITHSLIIFAVIFAVIYFISKKPYWVMCGWLLHILIDIPTHSYKFFPTPFLWPISSWKFNGSSWANPWFLLVDYAALVVVYLFIRKKRAA